MTDADEIWIANGREIPVSDMDDQHARNALRWIVRDYKRCSLLGRDKPVELVDDLSLAEVRHLLRTFIIRAAERAARSEA